MTDSQRLDYLAVLMNVSVLLELGADSVPPSDAKWADDRSARIFDRYEFHRRTHPTEVAFRLAVDDAAGPLKSKPMEGNSK